jgi:hypothetical protein
VTCDDAAHDGFVTSLRLLRVIKSCTHACKAARLRKWCSGQILGRLRQRLGQLVVDFDQPSRCDGLGEGRPTACIAGLTRPAGSSRRLGSGTGRARFPRAAARSITTERAASDLPERSGNSRRKSAPTGQSRRRLSCKPTRLHCLHPCRNQLGFVSKTGVCLDDADGTG